MDSVIVPEQRILEVVEYEGVTDKEEIVDIGATIEAVGSYKENISDDIINVGTVPEIIEEEEPDKQNITDEHITEFLITDPTTWKHENLTSERIRQILDYIRKQDIDKIDFTKSKVAYKSQNRCASKGLFFKKLMNGEWKKREWMFYSEESRKIFCVPCKL